MAIIFFSINFTNFTFFSFLKDLVLKEEIMMYFETLKTIRSFQFHLSFSSNVPLLHVMFQNCLVVFISHGYDNNFWGFDMAALHQYRKLDPNSIARGARSIPAFA